MDHLVMDGLVVLLLLVHVALWVVFRSDRASADTGCPSDPDSLPPVSVVVAVRNEAVHMEGLLDALLGQDHDAFEVILVDDGSDDEGASMVAARAALDDRLRWIRQEPSGKKAALTRGIREAHHAICVFTDADCRPGPGWLREHARRHSASGLTVVVGAAPLACRPSFLGRWQAFHAALNRFLTASAIGAGAAYLATGRNLSYPKSLFEDTGGFGGHASWLSGDDTLFIQQVRKGGSARICWADSPAIQVVSPARDTWMEWVRQKRRQTSTGRMFDKTAVLRAGLFHWSMLLVWLTALVAAPGMIALVWVGTVLLMAWTLGPMTARPHEPSFAGLLPVFAPMYLIFSVTVPVVGMLLPPRSWQSRSSESEAGS